MTRRSIKSQQNVNLNELIDSYVDVKASADSYKKDADAKNKKIKQVFDEKGINIYETDNFVAKITKTKRESFNEDKVLQRLKEKLTPEQQAKVIKVKKFYDENELEKLIYNNEFDVQELADCKNPAKEIVTLRVGKLKIGRS